MAIQLQFDPINKKQEHDIIVDNSPSIAMVNGQPMHIYRGKEDYISASDIRNIRSPKEYLHKIKERRKAKETGMENVTVDMIIGNYVHTHHLESHELVNYAVTDFPFGYKSMMDIFIRAYVASNDKQRAYEFAGFKWSFDRVCDELEKPENKNKLCFALENKDKLIVDPDTYSTCVETANSMRENIPYFEQFLGNCYYETSFYSAFLVDEDGNDIEQIPIEEAYSYPPERIIKVKCRPDFVNRDLQYIGDIKTCQDASKKGFARTAGDMEYFVQGAFYIDIVSFVMKKHINEFYFTCAEKTEPYSTNNFLLPNMYIKYGRNIYKRRLLAIKKCINEQKWDGLEINSDYDDGVSELNIPMYYMKEEYKF